MTYFFLVGDWVTWTSQANGRTKAKFGYVVRVVHSLTTGVRERYVVMAHTEDSATLRIYTPHTRNLRPYDNPQLALPGINLTPVTRATHYVKHLGSTHETLVISHVDVTTTKR